MSNKGNFILGGMLSAILLLCIAWMVQLQTKMVYPDSINKTMAEKIVQRSINRGKVLFKRESCTSCHKVNTIVCFGARLENITERRDRKWLYRYIREEQVMFNEGEPDVVALREEFKGAIGLHNKKHLTDAEIDDVLNYLDSF